MRRVQLACRRFATRVESLVKIENIFLHGYVRAPNINGYLVHVLHGDFVIHVLGYSSRGIEWTAPIPWDASDGILHVARVVRLDGTPTARETRLTSGNPWVTSSDRTLETLHAKYGTTRW